MPTNPSISHQKVLRRSAASCVAAVLASVPFVKLLAKKAEGLRERLEKAQNKMEKILECGEEMDGNTSDQEEDDFIKNLEKAAPTIFSGFDSVFG